MKHTALLGVLNFPSPITGDVYPKSIIQEVIKRYRKRVDGRVMTGCLFDNKKSLNDAIKNRKTKHNTKYEADIYRLQRELNYYKIKSMNLSHIITDMAIDGENWMVEIETLPTGKGLKLESLLAQNEKITFKPVIAKDRKNGIVISINELVSVDGIWEKKHGSPTVS